MARRTRGRKTDYTWSGICGSFAAKDIAVGTAAIGSGRIDFLETQTLVRVRGRVAIQLDAAGVDERVLVAVGLIKVKTAAAVAGIASVPTPNTETAADWLWFNYQWVSAGAEAAVNQNSLFDVVEVDSKAMRRCKADESLIFVAEVCDTVDMGGTVDVQYGIRVLVGV